MNYETLLRKHSLKVTPQRVGILTIMQERGHIDIEMLFLEIREKFPSISLATLYKNVNAMSKARIITEIKVPASKIKYEIIKKPHIHILCKECDEFMDLDIDLASLISEATQKSSYTLQESCIVLSGVCQKCQDNTNPN